MNFSDVLNAPRDAIYNLGRGAYRGLSGEGSIDDFVGAIPGALGILGAGMAAPFTGGLSLPFGAALAGASQLGGKLTGQDRFDAAGPSELLKALGYDNPDDFSTFATGMATDPMTWLTGAGAFKYGGKIGGKIGSMLGRAAPEAEAVADTIANAAGRTAVRRPTPLAAAVGPETEALMKVRGNHAAMLASPERKALEAMVPEPLASTVGGWNYSPSAESMARTRSFRPQLGDTNIGYEPPGIRPSGAGETMLQNSTRPGSSPLLDLLEGPPTSAPLGLPVRPSMGSPLLTSASLGAAEQTQLSPIERAILAIEKKPVQTGEGGGNAMFRKGKEAFRGPINEAQMRQYREALAKGYNINMAPDYQIFPGGIGR